MPHYCDYCSCSCHPFELCVRVGKVRDESNALTDEKFVKLIGKSSYTTSAPLTFFTSAFLVLYVQQDEPAAQSQLIPNSRQVSMLFGQEHRQIQGGPFRKQNNRVFMTTGFSGGRRTQWSEHPVQCALRQFQAEVGMLLDKAGVSPDRIKFVVEQAWINDQILAHIGRHSAQVTMFVPITECLMQRLVRAIPLFNRCSNSEVRSAVLMTEGDIMRQLTKFKEKIIFNKLTEEEKEGVPNVKFKPYDMPQFVVETLLDMNKNTMN